MLSRFCASTRSSTRVKPSTAASAHVPSILASKVNRVERSTSVPKAERLAGFNFKVQRSSKLKPATITLDF